MLEDSLAISDIWRDPILINTVGHSAGVLLFAVTIVLLARIWRTEGIRTTRLPMAAAGLALGWNIGSLVILASPDPAADWIQAVFAASFSMLSMLPAVLLQVTMQGRQPVVTALGYVISSLATILHIAEPFASGSSLHQAALILVAAGFGMLSLAALFRGSLQKIQTDRGQRVSLICLLLFASSFLHFGYNHTGSPWAAEITWHHIGIPVALVVLLRDYRFLLLDTFLRFFVNFGLSVLFVASALTLFVRVHLSESIGSSRFLTGAFLVIACLSLILFAHLRTALQAWMNRVIFRRQSAEGCVKRIEAVCSKARSEQELLSGAAHHIAEYLRTDHFAIADKKAEVDPPSESIAIWPPKESAEHAFRPEIQLPLRFSSGDTRYLLLGSRRGGQRYWSDDLNDMRLLGAAVVEQIERFRSQELNRLVTQAELRALQAQINPHFLFNALNTLYGTIDRGSRDARRIVLNLAELFRYTLQGSRSLIPLSKEFRIVEAYLEIEALRLGGRFTSEVLIHGPVGQCLIPILSVQPLVENAVKHGASQKSGAAKVTVLAEVAEGGVRISVQDTGIGFEKSQARAHSGTGVGLENVRRRLILSYGPSAHLNVQSGDAGSTVSFLVPQNADEKLSSAESEAMHA